MVCLLSRLPFSARAALLNVKYLHSWHFGTQNIFAKKQAITISNQRNANQPAWVIKNCDQSSIECFFRKRKGEETCHLNGEEREAKKILNNIFFFSSCTSLHAGRKTETTQELVSYEKFLKSGKWKERIWKPASEVFLPDRRKNPRDWARKCIIQILQMFLTHHTWVSSFTPTGVWQCQG